MNAARLNVVGTTQILVNSEVVPLSKTQRKLLAALALVAPEEMTLEALTFIVWDGAPPSTARTALHNQISRIRQRVLTQVVETTDSGYKLVVRTDLDDVVDLHRNSIDLKKQRARRGL